MKDTSDRKFTALIIFKPDAAHRLSPRREIWNGAETQKGIEITSLQWFIPPRSLISQHYSFLSDKPFLPGFVTS